MYMRVMIRRSRPGGQPAARLKRRRFVTGCLMLLALAAHGCSDRQAEARTEEGSNDTNGWDETSRTPITRRAITSRICTRKICNEQEGSVTKEREAGEIRRNRRQRIRCPSPRKRPKRPLHLQVAAPAASQEEGGTILSDSPVCSTGL